MSNIYPFSFGDINSEKPSAVLLSDLAATMQTAADYDNIFFSLCSAVCREALGFFPYESQITAAHHLTAGKIIEMATGEGKTIAAVFAAARIILPGLQSGEPKNGQKKKRVHILTYNDYLAKRDYHWMKPLYDLFGIQSAYITEISDRDERRRAYCAVVWVDYLQVSPPCNSQGETEVSPCEFPFL